MQSAYRAHTILRHMAMQKEYRGELQRRPVSKVEQRLGSLTTATRSILKSRLNDKVLIRHSPYRIDRPWNNAINAMWLYIPTLQVTTSAAMPTALSASRR